MKFTELDLHPDLQKAIDDLGFADCMPVQAECLPHTIAGRDVCAQAQTGTGKTAAFLITVFQRLAERDKENRGKVLVIVPTRELAQQVEEEAKELGKYLDITMGSFYGGVGYAKQEKLLEKDVDVCIGTPGRLIDFMQKKKLDFRQFKYVVIDEADRLFDMGFIPDIRKMMRQLPKYNQRQTMLWSATLTTRVKQLAWEYMNDAVQIEINPEQLTVDRIIQELYHVSSREKFGLLLGLIDKEQPSNAIIFTNTKQMAYEVAMRLEHNGYTAAYIIGDLPQSKRQKTLDDFKKGKPRFLVATAVASRGLHIDDLPLVINYDLPQDREDYVHRIGRTARVDKTGKAISLVCEKFVYNLEALEKYIDQEIPMLHVTDELVYEDKSAGMRFRLARTEDRDRDRGGRGGRGDKGGGRSGGGRGRGRSGQGGGSGKPGGGRKRRSRKLGSKKESGGSYQDDLQQLNNQIKSD